MNNNTLYNQAISLVNEHRLVDKYAHYKSELTQNDFTVVPLPIDLELPPTPIRS